MSAVIPSTMTSPKLRVLVVHNRYQERGGEDSVFEAETALLEEHGHEVHCLVFDNRDIAGGPPLSRVSLAVDTVWSRPARQRLREAIRAARPDVVHFHNTFPQVSPAAYGVCHEMGAAVVQTLHNYRLVCPAALLHRDGAVCNDCVGTALPLPAVLHACYRGSRAQSAVVATMLVAHRLRGTWRNDVDLYIAPSAFLKRKVAEGGLHEDAVVVKPNFVTPDPGPKAGDGAYMLFVGRLTETKGVETLLDAYRLQPELPPLQIVGDGPLASAVMVAAATDARITYRGRLERDGVIEAMKGARALVFASTWYENFPVTIAEAFACGLPVIGARIGAITGLIDDGNTGRLFSAGNPHDLAATIAAVWADADATRAMGKAARMEYETHLTGEANYAALIGAYELALTRAADMNHARRRFHQWKVVHNHQAQERIPASREPRSGIFNHPISNPPAPPRTQR